MEEQRRIEVECKEAWDDEGEGREEDSTFVTLTKVMKGQE